MMLEGALADMEMGLLAESNSRELREQETGRDLWPRERGWIDKAASLGFPGNREPL